MAHGGEPDWTMGTAVPATGRYNLYSDGAEELSKSIIRGKSYALVYPIESTGLVMPEAPLKNFTEKDSGNPLKSVFENVFKGFTGVRKFNDVFRWLGLHEYPKESDGGVYSVPYPGGVRPHYLMGYSPINRYNTDSFTISCAVCHSGNLFGKTILGMTNRFPRANALFFKGKQSMKLYNPAIFRMYEHATVGELKILADAKINLKKVSIKMPVQLGLDTSIAQVALSLNRRNPDAWATESAYYEKYPRADQLDVNAGDSKPAVWWNLKYKNRWLSDGSVLSGNPVFTNILWNEIGRSSDLLQVDRWLTANSEKIKDLTNAVFSIEAPRIVDFFPSERIDLVKAKRGQGFYREMCMKCHGDYVKNWEIPGNDLLPYGERLKTYQVKYFKTTKVVDVGTDPMRRIAMKSLEKLNDLVISQKNLTVVKAQDGYVAPPLVGIWARWPYFHNNSVPSLCALLSPTSLRPVTFYTGEANNTATDFDFQCNGYPSGPNVPQAWKLKRFLYDTRRTGMSNMGHDERVLLKNGQELLSSENKLDLIQFLQTL